jgi:ornithine cyclodeaminase
MARAEAVKAYLVGTGRLAAWMARAHVALRPDLQRVLVWGRRLEAAQALAAELAGEGLPAQAVPDLEAAVRAARSASRADAAGAVAPECVLPSPKALM